VIIVIIVSDSVATMNATKNTKRPPSIVMMMTATKCAMTTVSVT
jgi:hypothetical protein